MVNELCTFIEITKWNYNRSGLESRKWWAGATLLHLGGQEHRNIDHFVHHRMREQILLWFHEQPGSCVFIWFMERHFSIIQVFQVINREKPSGWEGEFLRAPGELSLYWTAYENICCSVAVLCNHINSWWMPAIKEISIHPSIHLMGISHRVIFLAVW